MMITSREREVLELLAQGLSTKQIAVELGISFKTAACHRANLIAKTRSRNTAHLISQTAQLISPACPGTTWRGAGTNSETLGEPGLQSATAGRVRRSSGDPGVG